MSKINPYKLLVEGAEDKRVIPELIERHGIQWELGLKEYLVDIQDCDGINNIIRDKFISAQYKGSELRALGIIVDADGLCDDQPTRIPAVLRQCEKALPEWRWELTPGGIIASNSAGKKLGLWVMPDNVSPGMLEDLLLTLPPPEHSGLVDLARQATETAKREHSAPYIEAHKNKAILHTWLAWQDPPGRQLHQAVKENLLQANTPLTTLFVKWFTTLFPPVTKHNPE